MCASSRRGPLNRLLVDLNTQCDFLLPRGVLPVTNRAAILPNIRRITNWARVEGVPVVSSLESHRPGEPTDGLPPYCIERSLGQRKLPFTLMPQRIVLCGDNTFDVPFEPFRRYQQVIFTKRNRDFLSNPKAERLLNAVRVRYIAIFGVLTEQCVKIAALGLLARGHRVIVVRDACGYWSPADAELALRQAEAKGAVIATTEELLNGQAEARLGAGRRPFFTEDNEPTEPLSDHAGSGVNGRGKGNGNGRGRKTTGVYTECFTQPAQPAAGGGGSDKPAEVPQRLIELARRKTAAHRPVTTKTPPNTP
jgi:nicotinamidase/pyrazinamidase